MKDKQVQFYQDCPIWYWPWLWLQFRRLDAWMANRLAQGELGEVMLHMSPRGTLTVTLMSDNLRDDAPISYTTLTFESLTWAYFPEWMYTVARALIGLRTTGKATGVQTIAPPAEISDALIPIP